MGSLKQIGDPQPLMGEVKDGVNNVAGGAAYSNGVEHTDKPDGPTVTAAFIQGVQLLQIFLDSSCPKLVHQVVNLCPLKG